MLNGNNFPQLNSFFGAHEKAFGLIKLKRAMKCSIEVNCVVSASTTNSRQIRRAHIIQLMKRFVIFHAFHRDLAFEFHVLCGIA